ncbi:histidine kinase [Sphingomonas sp. ID1715]|uniref:EF-hand domain-containing protein n=1 Tax=Sphingomonas sp. ID1715 TaxID=1656898 RepID=UPI0014878B19|nr:histidine kinase [Sphingomonas sp. ID1715]NNM77932.1 histidine kinase [Sphingomonas sp. ID1715]
MWRFLAGVASALLLCGAGLVWWTNGRSESPLLSAVAPPLARDSGGASDPGAPPAAEERTREEKRFDRYDKDRDQKITPEEYLLSRRKAYAKLDANGDGRLSFEEWAKKTTDKFAKADADGSKALSRTEFATTKVVRKTKAPVKCAPPKEEDEG